MTYSYTGHKRYLGLFGNKISDLNWKEVVEIWRNNEENLEHRKKYWQGMGHDSWQGRRKRMFVRFGIKDLSWSMLETWNSASWAPFWSYANFKSWSKLAQAHNYGTFYDLVRHEQLQRHEPLVKLVQNFPAETTVIGIELNGRLYIIEGMHRCSAAALAHWQHKKLETNIKIVVGRKIDSGPMFLRTRIKNPIAAKLITSLRM